MHNGLDRVLAEAEPELLAIGEVAQDEVAPSDEGAVAIDQIVEDDGVVAAVVEQFIRVRADVASPAGDHYHKTPRWAEETLWSSPP